MDNINKIYSISPPGLMRPDRDELSVDNSNTASAEMMPESTHDCIDGMPLAMAYVPRQKWQNIYENSKAVMRGTIFSDLDLPFKGAGKK